MIGTGGLFTWWVLMWPELSHALKAGNSQVEEALSHHFDSIDMFLTKGKICLPSVLHKNKARPSVYSARLYVQCHFSLIRPLLHPLLCFPVKFVSWPWMAILSWTNWFMEVFLIPGGGVDYEVGMVGRETGR